MRNWREELERFKGKQQQVIERQALLEKKLSQLQTERLELEQTQVIIQNVAQLTQNELRYQVSEIVTLALAAVFDDPYELEVSFEQRRNQTECDIFFVRNGEPIDPLTASGGGAVDVAAFALRVALWALKSERNRPLLILDEPLKFLKGGDLPERGAKMLKEISAKLRIQLIYVSHIPEQVESADKVFYIKKKRGISYVSEG